MTTTTTTTINGYEFRVQHVRGTVEPAINGDSHHVLGEVKER